MDFLFVQLHSTIKQKYIFNNIKIMCKCDLSNTFYFENDVQ